MTIGFKQNYLRLSQMNSSPSVPNQQLATQDTSPAIRFAFAYPLPSIGAIPLAPQAAIP